jgi:uncharacterized protein YgiM (DUF1202 family)
MKKNILRISILVLFALFIWSLKSNISLGFEKSVADSTGWSTIDLSMRTSANTTSSVVSTVPAGEAFLIVSENGDYWKVKYNNKEGYIPHQYCMINLPDVIPSI